MMTLLIVLVIIPIAILTGVFEVVFTVLQTMAPEGKIEPYCPVSTFDYGNAVKINPNLIVTDGFDPDPEEEMEPDEMAEFDYEIKFNPEDDDVIEDDPNDVDSDNEDVDPADSQDDANELIAGLVPPLERFWRRNEALLAAELVDREDEHMFLVTPEMIGDADLMDVAEKLMGLPRVIGAIMTDDGGIEVSVSSDDEDDGLDQIWEEYES